MRSKEWRSRKGRPSSIKWKQFYWELQDLLNIPRQVHYSKGGFRYERPDKAAEIVHTIVKVLVDALKRGESVKIAGFGTFDVIDNPKKSVYRPFTASSSDGTPLGQSELILPLPPRKKVIFTPSIHLTAMLNMNRPNAFEKRAMKTWKTYDN